jgi:hypothetical protein
MKDLGVLAVKPTLIRVDNQAAIHYAAGPKGLLSHKTTRHINVDYHYIRQKVEERQVSVEWVPSRDNAADALTKPLPADAFERHRKILCGLC